MDNPTAQSSRFSAIIRLRCPRCLHGHVFQSLLRMNNQCPECGLTFYREYGYFVGAMYFSYAMSTVVLATLAFATSRIFPEWSFPVIVGVAFLASLPFVPFIFRYARVMWLHFDRLIDPPKNEQA